MRAVLDSSALVSIILRESDAEMFLTALTCIRTAIMSAVNVFETRTVLQARKGAETVADFDTLMRQMAVEIVPFGLRQAEDAFAAYRRFGKGMGSPARLNLADCAAYTLSKSTGAPLLFKGNDFNHTDVTPALPLLVPEAGGRTL